MHPVTLSKLTRYAVICLSITSSIGLMAQCNPEVLAETTPSQRFYTLDVTRVKDLKTGLMWQRCPVGARGVQCDQGLAQRMNWQQAQQQAPAISDPYRWRLPTIKELRSLLEARCAMPAINTDTFPATPSAKFWTSSSSELNTNEAWFVDFERGKTNDANQLDRYFVRLVRTLRLEERTQ